MASRAGSQAWAWLTQHPCRPSPSCPACSPWGQAHIPLFTQPGWLNGVEGMWELLRAMSLAQPHVQLVTLSACSVQALSKVLAVAWRNPMAPTLALISGAQWRLGVHPGSLSFLLSQPGLGQGASQSVISVQLCPVTPVPWKHHPLLPSHPRRHLKATSHVTFLCLGSELFPHGLGPSHPLLSHPPSLFCPSHSPKKKACHQDSID